MGDSVVDNPNSESAPRSSSELDQNDSAEQRIEQAYDGSEDNPQEHHQDADLPMFFGRIAK